MTDSSKGGPEKAAHSSPTSPTDDGTLTAHLTAALGGDRDTAHNPTPKTVRPDAEGQPPPATSAPDVAHEATTATASAIAEAGRFQIAAAGARTPKPLEPVDPSARLGRPSAPVLAGAAIAGLVLVATPFAVSAGTQGVSLETVPLSAGSLVDGSDLSGSHAQAAQARTDSANDQNSTEGGVNDAPVDSSIGYVPEALTDKTSPGSAQTLTSTDGDGASAKGEGRDSPGSDNPSQVTADDDTTSGIIDTLPDLTPEQLSAGRAQTPPNPQPRTPGSSPESASAPQEQDKRDQQDDAEVGTLSAPASPSASAEPSAPPSTSQPPSASPSTTAPSPYSEVAGPGCESGETSSYGRTGHWQEDDGAASWSTRDSGERGCRGPYDAIPVSGDPERGNGQFAHWTFTPGIAGIDCDLYVYIPDDESPLWIAEQEAKYQIFSGDRPSGETVGIFGVNQSKTRGGWIKVTGLTSPAESFTVQLTNIGANPLADQSATSHVAASAVRAACA